jgi:hypothetical protein
MSSFEFTRYLYEKEEVIYSFTLSLLYKKEEEAFFWATELYESGFTEELYQTIWNNFQDFYASLNLPFEKSLLKRIISLTYEKNILDLFWIIKNLIKRPTNLDTFSLIKLQEEFEIDPSILNSNLESFLEMNDYLQITKLFLETWGKKSTDELEKQFRITLEFYQDKPFFPKKSLTSFLKDWETTKKLLSSAQIPYHPQKLLLTRILYFKSLEAKLKTGKNITIKIQEQEIQQQIQKYKTLEVDLQCQEGKRIPVLPAYRILPKARIYSIHPDTGLFTLKRNQPFHNIKEAYLYNWLYYASFSPIWKKRVEEFQGTINHPEKSVHFLDLDKEEEFYTQFGYEPDEQSQECHDKSIKALPKLTWKEWFQQEYEKPKQNKLYIIPQEFLSHFL